ncbi:MAG: GspE/PulE family protein [Patescibacteria group bacterium]
MLTLSDILVSQGSLTAEKAKLVALDQIQTGTPEEDIIIQKEFVNETQLAKAKAVYFNVPYVDLSQIPASPEALAVLSQDVAERFKVFPVSVDKGNKRIVLAMADPMNLSAIDFVERKTGYHVSAEVAEESVIKEFTDTKYAQSISREVTEAVSEVSVTRDEVKNYEAGSKFGFIKEEKIAEIVSHILEFAIRARSSDIHIEPQEKSTRVRYRIDGILQEKLTIPREIHDSLISRIKILSGMKIDEKRVPQDGRFNFKVADQDVDLRVSSLPTSWGEKIVMRLLKKTGGVPTLPELGLRGRGLKNLEDAVLRPHGIILICGPTGSGKTTTLYSIISKINTSKVNIVTLEDPIEYKIAGVNQVQINPAAGLTFASGLRSFLRQDPNIILVGEIRDQETADLAIQASLTGHLVFSTLHTNDASGALPRLLDMGAEPYLLASSVTAIMAQRVIRKIHDKCKTAFTPDAKIAEEVKANLGNLWPEGKDVKFYKGTGDPECGNSGYFGRVGIYEVMPVTEKMSKLILERASSNDIEKLAKDEGMITLKQDGYLKVLEGMTSIEEVLRVAQE